MNEGWRAALDGLPRVDLGAGAVRVEPMPRLATRLVRGGLYVVRDDVLGLGLGGTKVRSLELWLGAAEAEHADTLLIAGGQGSNQCRLVAAAAAKRGLSCVVLYDGAPPETERGNLFLARLFGAELRFDPSQTEATRPAALARAVRALRAAGRRPHVVGDPVLGALGCVAAATGVAASAAAREPPIRHLALAGSMGPTEAGVILGLALAGAPVRVRLVSVEYAEDELRRRVDAILAEASSRLAVASPAVAYDVDVERLGAGYGQPTETAVEARDLAARTEALLLDPVYTAKTFDGFLALARSVPPDVGVAFWHTGGVPTLFG